ncbi:MAG: SUMF1/EgtB/PvdO family nonheme iron enzyme [Caldilineaceae bacterium]
MPNSYLDFDLEIGKGKDGIYAIQARWQGNEAWQEAQLVNDTDPAVLRQAIEEAVYHSPLRRRKRSGTNYEATVQGLGQQLFDFALSGEVLAQLRACQRAAKSQHKEGVRLRLRIFDPELAGLPWEYLYDSRLRDFIALDPTLPLVRYLHHPHAVAPTSLVAPLRILAMVAAPINLPALDVTAEKQRVEQAVANLQADGRVELHWLSGETALDLQSALRKGPWHIFHFIGHGDFDPLRDEGYVVLCNPRNRQAEPLYATQLARLLAAQSNHLRFVLLNACDSGRGSSSDIFSSTAETLINRDLPAVLAMQYSITDDAATLFAQHLYESLADGLPIDRSVAEARNALALADSQNLEWGVPVLHMRLPDGVLFELASAESGMRNAESDRRSSANIVQDKPATRHSPATTRTPKIDFDWVTIAAGEFLMGSDRAKDKCAFGDELPQHKLYLPSFKIARVPVTVEQFAQFIKATGYKTTAEQNSEEYYWAAPRGKDSDVRNKQNHPVTCVTWHDAIKFCEWAEVRLPTEAEWERAARWTDGRIYPWGNEAPDQSRCNFDRNVSDTTPVGNYPKGVSKEGVLDMAGNVWEWVSTKDEAYPYDAKDGREELTGDEHRLLRGGSWFYPLDFVRGAIRYNNNAVDWNDDFGFRVVISVSPGS